MNRATKTLAGSSYRSAGVPFCSIRPVFNKMIREVLDVMRDLARDGMTMAVVTHEMGFAREVCDRIVFIDDGHIVEEGSPKEFFEAAKSDRARDFVDKIIHH